MLNAAAKAMKEAMRPFWNDDEAISVVLERTLGKKKLASFIDYQTHDEAYENPTEELYKSDYETEQNDEDPGF